MIPAGWTTAANLIEHVLPRVALRQWVLTLPFRWRRRLAQDGEQLGAVSRIFVSTVQAFYGGKTGAMTVVHPFGYHEARQRTSSDLRLNPHLHVVFLDGSYQGGTSSDDDLVWREHGHLQTRERRVLSRFAPEIWTGRAEVRKDFWVFHQRQRRGDEQANHHRPPIVFVNERRGFATGAVDRAAAGLSIHAAF